MALEVKKVTLGLFLLTLFVRKIKALLLCSRQHQDFSELKISQLLGKGYWALFICRLATVGAINSATVPRKKIQAPSGDGGQGWTTAHWGFMNLHCVGKSKSVRSTDRSRKHGSLSPPPKNCAQFLVREKFQSLQEFAKSQSQQLKGPPRIL